MFKILVVEDDRHIRNIIEKRLEKAGYEPLLAFDGREGIALFESQKVDLIITDIMMPHVDGISLVKEVRSTNPNIPIIMLTALDHIKDKENSFISGADDYIVKPVDMKELILRIQSLLRRYKIINNQLFEHKSILLNYKTFVCQINQKDITLTKKEFMLLFKLLSSAGQIFTREQLMNDIWGYDSFSYERTIDTHIKRLREKIDTSDFELVTVRGLGYKAVLL
ncbi:MAG: response regulator transcription factor [Tenericutes bacterium]|jgi:two-component system OmpR family response regulator|nr:response regulator transcription factor [Mycoplasmatota bacterium]